MTVATQASTTDTNISSIDAPIIHGAHCLGENAIKKGTRHPTIPTTTPKWVWLSPKSALHRQGRIEEDVAEAFSFAMGVGPTGKALGTLDHVLHLLASMVEFPLGMDDCMHSNTKPLVLHHLWRHSSPRLVPKWPLGRVKGADMLRNRPGNIMPRMLALGARTQRQTKRESQASNPSPVFLAAKALNLIIAKRLSRLLPPCPQNRSIRERANLKGQDP